MSSPNALPNRSLIVVSLEGFARSSLGCYGSSWNRTPAIDAIAADGCIWDRMIALADNPSSVLKRWFDSGSRWPERWRAGGSLELLTDAHSFEGQDAACFDHLERLDDAAPSPTDVPANEIVDTQFGRLIAAAIERDSNDEPWSVLWLHSNFLTRRWDAPRELFPIDEIDLEPMNHPELTPEEERRSLDASTDTGVVDAQMPPIFDSVVPPHIELNQPVHPDLISSWMRTYGCQIRLVDLLIEVLLQSLRTEDPWLVLVGASGFQLGQSGWIGHRAGPLRSADIHLPMIVSDCGPLRVPYLSHSDELADVLGRLPESDPILSPEVWSRPEKRSARVETQSDRAQQAITTPEWFYVRDADQQEHLFLKPDDVEDFNDVGRVRDDIVDQLRTDKKEPC